MGDQWQLFAPQLGCLLSMALGTGSDVWHRFTVDRLEYGRLPPRPYSLTQHAYRLGLYVFSGMYSPTMA